MLSFLANPPKRTHTASLDPLPLVGHYTSSFPNSPKPSIIANRQFLPPYSGPNTFGTPPYHYHLRQYETFTVESGSLLVTVDEQKSEVRTGESVTVQPGQYHTFRNASESEDLQILIELPRLGGNVGMFEEKFLRNSFSYGMDCKRDGNVGEPSPWQMLLFLWDAEIFLAFPIKGVPRKIQRGVSWIVMFVGGVVIGERLLGYKRTYPEYYNEPSGVGEQTKGEGDGAKVGKED
ncbi:unnamed protein product [Tuber aestivum]|uniref:Cupin type-2 domain-containing protein n=1 Tax=Tuber aestivum TaxID=59557 RepID=A0A292Q9X5_9PEZI|nr:unnamed protein product [Tuber aestivum]